MQFYPKALRSAVRNIFKKGSTTYYYSSIFFPPKVKDDIFALYAFVRVADDFVDATPQDIKSFIAFRKKSQTAFNGTKTDDPIIDAFAAMCARRDIPYEYVDAFFDAMQADTKENSYNNFADLERYMYGSAEVVGLMMAKILDLPKRSYPWARSLGKAMQLINFVRDVEEDKGLGRTYLPAEDMRKFGVTSLTPKTEEDKRKLSELIRYEISRYREIQLDAEKGYADIPPQYLIPIKTAADMYNWTADQIDKNPLIVLERKVKPHPYQVISQIAINYFRL